MEFVRSENEGQVVERDCFPLVKAQQDVAFLDSLVLCRTVCPDSDNLKPAGIVILDRGNRLGLHGLQSQSEASPGVGRDSMGCGETGG